MFSKLRLINEHRFGMQGVFMGQLVLYNKNQIGTKTYWFFFYYYIYLVLWRCPWEQIYYITLWISEADDKQDVKQQVESSMQEGIHVVENIEDMVG